MREQLVVVGGGQAAVQAIQALRQHGFDGKIALLADEAHPPYQRPPLSKKYLAGELPRERLYLKPESFYASRDVDLLLGIGAVELDIAGRRISLANDKQIKYDRLLLATGSRARRIAAPGADLAGIHYIRSIADVDELAPELRPGARLVIVGAGYIGLEVAAVARGLGLDVTVLEAADRVMSRVVCRETADFYARCHASAGVEIRCNSPVAEFLGTGAVTGVASAVGEIFACDLVIVGIGVVPNVELAARAGLHCDNGIRVDSCSRTADPRIVAAGDCTNHPHPFVGRHIRLESVHNAVEQGKSAAMSLLGQAHPFEEVPWFWSDQYDLKLQIVGVALDYDEVVLRGDPESRSFAIYYLAAGRPIAIDAVNSPRDFMHGKKLLAARPIVPAAAIADLGFDLTQFLA
jgi:3-phenylpropionate/trans-cinnamate dioxygenase ferredoxin reductase component